MCNSSKSVLVDNEGLGYIPTQLHFGFPQVDRRLYSFATNDRNRVFIILEKNVI